MKFIVPLKFHKSKKKLLSVSLNVLLKTSYFNVNNGKKEFFNILKEKYGYAVKPVAPKVLLLYTVFFPDNRDSDVGNFGPGAGKFAEDALVKLGYLEDDNRKIVKEIRYRDGGIDRQDPRAELEIIDYEKRFTIDW